MSMIRRELPRSIGRESRSTARVRNSRCRGFSFRVPEPSTDGTAATDPSWMDKLTDGPDEADQLTPHGHGRHGRSLSPTGHPKELAVQSKIALMGNVE